MTTTTKTPTAHRWRIHWQHIEPTLIEYQEAVPFDLVMSEHRAAVAAEPIETVADPRYFQGSNQRG